MYQILENYIRLVFENEENKNQTFEDLLNSLSLEKKQDSERKPRNLSPIELNTDQTGYERMIKNASKPNQTH